MQLRTCFVVASQTQESLKPEPEPEWVQNETVPCESRPRYAKKNHSSGARAFHKGTLLIQLHTFFPSRNIVSQNIFASALIPPTAPTCSFFKWCFPGQLLCSIVSVVQFVTMVEAISMRPLPVHLSVGSLRASCCAREVLRAWEDLNLFGVIAGAPRETGRPGDRSFSWRHVRAHRGPHPRSNDGWRRRGVPRRHPCRSLFR